MRSKQSAEKLQNVTEKKKKRERTFSKIKFYETYMEQTDYLQNESLFIAKLILLLYLISENVVKNFQINFLKKKKFKK